MSSLIFLIIVGALGYSELQPLYQTYKHLIHYTKQNNICFDEPLWKFVCYGFIKHIELIKQFAQDTINKANDNNINIELGKHGIEAINKINARLLVIMEYITVFILIVTISPIMIYGDSIKETLMISIVGIIVMFILMFVMMALALFGAKEFSQDLYKINQVYKDMF